MLWLSQMCRLPPPVARALDQQVFCYFGLPEHIHSDEGAYFQSQVMSDLCKTLGVASYERSL